MAKFRDRVRSIDPRYKVQGQDLPRILPPMYLTKASLKTSKRNFRKSSQAKSSLGRINNPEKIRRTNVIMMRQIGLDLGTKHIVLAYRDQNRNLKTSCEVNGYMVLPRNDSFTEQLLKQNGVPYVTREIGSKKEFIAIGSKAEKLAYSFNKSLRRPMAEGAVSRNDDDAQEIIAIIIKSLIGKLEDDSIIYYCTTAKPINSDMNVEFHRKIVKLIIESYACDEIKVQAYHINEARCLLLKEQGAAIGISWGAGTVTVHAGIFGVPIFEFCVVGSGDWVDVEAAKRFGYDPAHPERDSSETPTSICRRKEEINLTSMPSDKVGQTIYLMYEILVDNVLRGIVSGFKENRDKFKFDQPIPIINAGGTSMPEGFMDLIKKRLGEMKDDIVFPIGDIRRVENPLFAVAHGCLTAAEMHQSE